MVSSVTRIERRRHRMTGTDLGARRRIGGVVLRGKTDELSEDEQRRAARLAALVTHSLLFRAVQSVTMMAGILLSNVRFLSGRLAASTRRASSS